MLIILKKQYTLYNINTRHFEKHNFGGKKSLEIPDNN